jgi:hypothetical protein
MPLIVPFQSTALAAHVPVTESVACVKVIFTATSGKCDDWTLPVQLPPTWAKVDGEFGFPTQAANNETTTIQAQRDNLICLPLHGWTPAEIGFLKERASAYRDMTARRAGLAVPFTFLAAVERLAKVVRDFAVVCQPRSKRSSAACAGSDGLAELMQTVGPKAPVRFKGHARLALNGVRDDHDFLIPQCFHLQQFLGNRSDLRLMALYEVQRLLSQFLLSMAPAL